MLNNKAQCQAATTVGRDHIPDHALGGNSPTDEGTGAIMTAADTGAGEDRNVSTIVEANTSTSTAREPTNNSVANTALCVSSGVGADAVRIKDN